MHVVVHVRDIVLKKKFLCSCFLSICMSQSSLGWDWDVSLIFHHEYLWVLFAMGYFGSFLGFFEYHLLLNYLILFEFLGILIIHNEVLWNFICMVFIILIWFSGLFHWAPPLLFEGPGDGGRLSSGM